MFNYNKCHSFPLCVLRAVTILTRKHKSTLPPASVLLTQTSNLCKYAKTATDGKRFHIRMHAKEKKHQRKGIL